MPTLVEPLGSGETVEDLFYRTVVGATDPPLAGRTEGLALIGKGICDVLNSNESTETYTEEGVVGMMGAGMREGGWDEGTILVVLVYSTVAFCPDHLHQNSVIRKLAEGLASEP